VEVVVEFALIKELRMFSVDGFKLDSNLKVGLGVDALVDLSEGSFSNFPDNLEIFPHLFW
jgi:hypothetical protein